MRKNGKRKHIITIAEWLIPLVGSNDCMLVQNDKQVDIKAEDRKEKKRCKIQLENKKRKRQITIEECVSQPPRAPLARTGEG